MLLDLGLGILGGGDDEILQDLDLGRIGELGIDLQTLHLAFAVERDLDHAAARLAGHLDALELGLHLRHAALHRLGLLHQLSEILHASSIPCSCSPAPSGPLSGAGAEVGDGSRSRTASTTLPGKAASAAWTRGWRSAAARSASIAACACCSRLGAPDSPDTATTQRRL